ncbi:PT domain-containing protein [Flexivirga oryzae]|uniref:Uncharacterized protein n=1 Tax=Flexivirga oryzae TaxID=1794944 RepID=A0A839NAY1_9MICO|nr:PT domain-containing protein [Flexivirga oryzae]MBB2891762.1 hypothetical protein [Flexivirga oryzae]
MKLYAERRSRALRQVGWDVLTVGWIAAWVWLGLHVHSQVSGSQDGARNIERSGGDLARHLHNAAQILSHTPLIGGKVRKPIDKSADAATSLQHAGGQLADNLGKLGAAIGFEVALVPVLVAVFGWLFLRVGYARRAGRATVLARQPGGADLLALDALTRLPAGLLADVDPRPVEKWRAGDEETITALADTYLGHLGLKPTRPTAPDDPRTDRPTNAPDDPRTDRPTNAPDDPRTDRPTNAPTGSERSAKSAEISEPAGEM